MTVHEGKVKAAVLAVLAIALLALPVVAGAADPVNGFTSPAPGATVSGSVDVTGYANAPAFWKWQLDLLPGGLEDQAIFLAVGENPGDFSYTLDTTAYPNGEHALRLRVVTTNANYEEIIQKFTIANGEAAAAPAATTEATAAAATETPAPVAAAATPAPAESNGFTNPKAGATVSGSVDVTGYADAPTFWKWQLDLLPEGSADNAIFLAVGETPGAFSYTLDTTPYPNGEHALRLRVVTTDANYTEIVEKFAIANGAAAPAATPVAAAGPASVMVTTNDTLGSFLADSKGMTLYLYTKDTPNTSNCYGACALAWPPLLTEGAATAGAGVDAALLGTTTRTDGSTQVTYNGWPLYYFAKDQKAGDVTGQNVGTVWFVVSPEGQKIETTAAAPAAAPATPAPAGANGITSPADGATVSGTVDVKGNANDPLFNKWQLDLLPEGAADNAIFVAVGETPGEFSYSLDTTAFPNGEHALRLRVVRSDSNYSEYITKVVIANQ
jgi:predicted lipoprotein with Yx(FWY)xxD motif